MNSSSPLLNCQKLTKSYQEGGQRSIVLEDINFQLYAQQLVAIVGSSGSGKSTLLHILSALDEPDSGEIYFQGENIQQLSIDKKAKWRNQNIGFVYQFHHLLSDFSAIENVAMPLLIAGGHYKMALMQAKQMLQRVGLANKLAQRPAELSGGERQRVAIARALINHPKIVMADEPTGNLDRSNANIIFDLLLEINQQEGITCLVVTHDNELATKLQSQWYMQDGKLQQQGVIIK